MIDPEPEFSLSTEARDDAVVITIGGPFDLSAVGAVENAVDVVLQSRLDCVVFDLRAVSFMDMAGLGTVLRANERARALSKELRVVPPEGLARRVFTLTRVGDHLQIVKSVAGY